MLFVVDYIIPISFGYIIGSIPFGLLLTRAGGHGDIRDIGSGNIGATNVLRTGNKKIAVATLLLDMAKGFVAVLLFSAVSDNAIAPMIAGLAAFVGHCFPVWLKFNGGKGVATFFGITAAWSFPVALVAAITWIGVAFLTRYSSLAALIAVLLTPLYFYLLDASEFVWVAGLLAALVYFRHKDNMMRLLNGAESKIGGSKIPSSEET